MRLRNTLAIAMLSLAASVSLTGCGDKSQPLTEAQMQRKQQELQIQAQQQQLDIQRAQAQADLDAQRLQNKAIQQQMLPAQQYQQPVVQQPVYSAPVQQYAPASAPVQHVDSGIGTGTAILGAAAVGAAGYALGKSSSNNDNYNNGNNYNTTRVQPATRIVTQPAPTRVYTPPQQAYKAPAPRAPSAGFTRLNSTKRR